MEQPADLVQQLEQIGLKPKEAQVYLALLSLESSTAYEVAQHCEVKKPTVYVILEDLRQKGLVLKVPHAKKALFAARDLSEYLAEQRGKLNAVQSMLPRLASLGSTKPNVYFFSGLQGMRQALDYKFDSMRGKTYRSFYGNLSAADKRVGALYKQWDKEAVDADVSFEIIMPGNGTGAGQTELKALASTNPKQVRIKTYAQHNQPGHTFIEIADTFVRIDDAKNITSTVIDDKATADAMRSIFDIVWKKGE